MSDSGHPARFGYRTCRWCGLWRPLPTLRAIDGGHECLDVKWCDSVTGPQRPVGWDANGAPTGVDANGDAT